MDLPPTLDEVDAVALARSVGSGLDDLVGVLSDRPYVLIDLDRAATPFVVPPAFPAVVIGISREGRTPSSRQDTDVLLSGRPAGRPWVEVADLERAVADLVVRIETTPMAALALVEVLRSARPGPVATGLVLESFAYSALQAGPEFGRWSTGRPPPLPGTEGQQDHVTASRSDGVLTITLDRPARHNAFGADVRDQLHGFLSLALIDTDVEAVHLVGAGPSFCSGGDLGEFGTLPDPVTAHLIRTSRSCALLLSELAGRTTVWLHGHCIGAGIELAAFASKVMARRSTLIRLPEVGMGLIPGAGGTVSIPRRIGRHRTAWLALSGAPIDVDVARRWGLVDQVVDD